MSIPTLAQDGVFEHKRRLQEFVSSGVLSADVINALLPSGSPLEYERQLWDYKRELPSLPIGRTPTDEEKESCNQGIAELIKDCVAFHNSYGGYILAGVANAPRDLVGFDGQFDCDQLNKRIQAATNQALECFYKSFDYARPDGRVVKLGLLFIPQRSDDVLPVQFQKDAPTKPSGKKAYSRRDLYLRKGDQCCPAETSEDYAFLCTPGSRATAAPAHASPPSPVLDSNLGARDESFIQFVGRESHLAQLWAWFFDKFSPVRLLAGVGGVGKTTLAREFAEQVARAAPFGFQKVVWLSAKKRTFTAIQGRYVEATRVDFADVDGLLRQICLELALNVDEVPEDATREALIESTVEALSTMPALVIVDDVDSLEPDQQQDLFHAMLTSFGQTIRGSKIGSRALLTSRLDLGAAPGQLLRVKGLSEEEFKDFVRITCAALDLSEAAVRAAEKRLHRFHRVSEGSPTFASSILRLVSLGESIDKAIQKWERADGEEVRRFAFARELDQLTDSSRGVLFALCVLGQSTLVELSVVLTRSEHQIREDLAELRRYHLTTYGDAHLPGGSQIEAPGTLRMMVEILREKVRDPSRIEKNCAKARAKAPKIGRDLRPQINTIAALWASERSDEALALALTLEREHPDDGDVKCIVGRAKLRTQPPDFRGAEVAFRRAQELACQRPELLPLWSEAKAALGDWTGLLHITEPRAKEFPHPSLLLLRADAYTQLIEMDRAARNLKSAAERALEGGREIDRAFRHRRATGAVEELRVRRRDLLTAHVDLVDQSAVDPDAHIETWLAASAAFECFVRSPRLLRLGANRLESWWRSVEKRGGNQARAADLLDVQLKRLAEMTAVLRKQEYPDQALYGYLVDALNRLENRHAAFRDDN